MPSAISTSRLMLAIGVSQLSATRGRNYVANFEAIQQQLLPTDAVGLASVTLTNVVVGSAIQIETQAGAVIVNRTATASTEVFSVPLYVSGNAANNLRIKVRKASAAPFYQPFETQTTATATPQSIFVSQILD